MFWNRKREPKYRIEITPKGDSLFLDLDADGVVNDEELASMAIRTLSSQVDWFAAMFRLNNVLLYKDNKNVINITHEKVVSTQLLTGLN